MRIRKGDLVHILSGKDRGKQGRVIDARPKDKKVIVENLNIVKRHTKPRPIQNASRMGTAGMTPGGVIEKPAPLPVGNVMVVCPSATGPRAWASGTRTRTANRSRSASASALIAARRSTVDDGHLPRRS